MSGPVGRIFSIQRYSVHDGPGVRTTVFFKGCPLRCTWCHNPESQAHGPDLMVHEARCIRCGACVEACPSGAAAGEGTCEACGRCAEVCPAGARELAGREVSAAALLEEVARDRVFYEESGGGVTFSGGEPLSQPAFLMACLRACRAAGLDTALDTCGFAPREVLLAAAALCDLVLFDLKAVDAAVHERFTGAPNGPILENLRALTRAHAGVWLRVPVVPGINDSEADVRAAANLAASLPGLARVCLLPYHDLGAGKSARLGRTAPPGPEPPTAEALGRIAAPFRRHGLAVQIGG